MDEKRKKKVALYIRVSTDEQSEMYGVDLQREALLSLIKSKPNEYEFAGENYIDIDEGKSGTLKPEQRPEFRRLMEDISRFDEVPFDVVAVYKIDRFARRLKILLEILDFFEQDNHKIDFISSQESIDTSTPFGRAMLGIIGVIAELELETIKVRTKAGKKQSAEQGIFQSNAPFGYIKDEKKMVKIEPEEEKIVKEIFNLYVHDKYTLQEIADYLRDRKVLTPSGYIVKHKKKKLDKEDLLKMKGHYKWAWQTVRRVLTDEIYIGNQYFAKSVDGIDLQEAGYVHRLHESGGRVLRRSHVEENRRAAHAKSFV